MIVRRVIFDTHTIYINNMFFFYLSSRLLLIF